MIDDELRTNTMAYSKGELSLTNQEVDRIKDHLMSQAWDIALLIDRIDGVDTVSKTKFGGTANKRSTTYKVRKALGYRHP